MTPLMTWLDDRTGFRSVMHEALYERVPGGARWRYVWGSTLVFVFMLQVITGFMLWMFYSPNTRGAWESVYYIQHEVYLGDIVRGLHHYAAQAMVVLIGIHLIQVVIDGAYRAPREINFWLGIILLNIVLGLSLTGYLLPWDQKGYYATRVTTNIVSSAPVIGPAAQILAQGGPQYGHLTLTRFFAMHAGILPTLLVAFLALHIYCFRRQGLKVADENHAPETTFWPDQVLKDAVACLGVLAVLLLFAVFRGAELGAPADPVVKFDAARPEWYYLFLFRFLRFHAVESLGVTFGAIIVPGVIMGILAAMPLTAKFLGESGHRINKVFTWGMTAVIVALTALAIVEDQADVNHQSAIAEAAREAHRAHELASGPDGIPAGGAMEMMRNDPFAQGPRLFAKHCASCHRWNGHNGRGVIVLDRREDEKPGGGSYDPKRFKSYTAVPTAADLGNFGTRDWMRGVILDYSEHFAWLKNAQWYTDSDDDRLDPDVSEMAEWSGDNDALTAPENVADVDAVIEFLVAETGREDLALDTEKVARGRAIAVDGDWSLESCATCHGTIGQDFVAVDTDDTYGYPTLAKYGSASWLKDFIRNPDAERHYGAKNRMPAYSAEKLGDAELDLLVRWITHDYPESRVEDYPGMLDRLRQVLESEESGSPVVSDQ
ncbi:MAG: cytochrome b N-terminal domain-containing protein [Fuerstiella sp.]|nr:cytochrome b N-terminal domain-containing protein [Fuerstiella sp.]